MMITAEQKHLTSITLNECVRKSKLSGTTKRGQKNKTEQNLRVEKKII